MNRKRILIISVIGITALIFLYAGLFLFGIGTRGGPSIVGRNGTQYRTGDGSVSGSDLGGKSGGGILGDVPAESVKFIHLARIINGGKQEINILEVNPSTKGVKIVPVLSHDLIYGYETLSSIASRKNSYAAVNAGFFHDYGIPAGMVVSDGTLYKAATGRYPVFTVKNGKADLEEMKTSLWIETTAGKMRVDGINTVSSKGRWIVYTSGYGSSNRAISRNFTITVSKGDITDMRFSEKDTEIPEEGLLISYFPPDGQKPEKIPFKIGDTAKLVTDPQITAGLQAYECGSWLVRDGKVVIGEKDAWIGVTTNNDPRTAIGLKEDGTVVLVTVDGRQPGYSEGLTCRALGEFLLDYGVTRAAMLDGGASTEMIVKGSIVNRPSFKGLERPLGGAIAVILDQ